MAGEAAKKTMSAETPTGITIKLDKPVMAHGEMVAELTFREPTGADIMEIDDPVVAVDYEGGFVVRGAPMGRMMSRLAAVPPSSIGSLGGKDFQTCAFRLMRFFVPGPQALSS